MPVYFYANIRVKDEAEYEKYLARVDEVFEKYKGEYLVVDESPELLEGSWDFTKSVLIKFESREEFRRWYYSEEYQQILKYRLRGADSDVVLLHGIEDDEV
jgi:uncharacterized protein (DUF1330 family)